MAPLIVNVVPHDKVPSTRSAASTAAGYDLVAAEYARRIYGELEAKPFDRAFLDRLAQAMPAGEVLDLGCGPGHVGRYLHERGIPARGLDISDEMVRLARELNPSIEFRQGDTRDLPFPDQFFAGVVAFYSIIHLEPAELEPVFTELRRVLRPGGLLALAFHIGNEVRHVDELWGIKTSLDFVFFDPSQVAGALSSAGFEVIESSQRAPYDPPVEAQTDRCYMVARRPSIERASGGPSPSGSGYANRLRCFAEGPAGEAAGREAEGISTWLCGENNQGEERP